jgi:hypothetical protein
MGKDLEGNDRDYMGKPFWNLPEWIVTDDRRYWQDRRCPALGEIRTDTLTLQFTAA